MIFCLYCTIKRLTIPVADHPLEWASFEGTITQGYGKGTVKLWDVGCDGGLLGRIIGTLSSMGRCYAGATPWRYFMIIFFSIRCVRGKLSIILLRKDTVFVKSRE
ncbi:MAG: DNA polymerase ligase N-terminal domain-containing protein [Candidatus Hermodarchaeota archaeon]